MPPHLPGGEFFIDNIKSKSYIVSIRSHGVSLVISTSPLPPGFVPRLAVFFIPPKVLKLAADDMINTKTKGLEMEKSTPKELEILAKIEAGYYDCASVIREMTKAMMQEFKEKIENDTILQDNQDKKPENE